jgi:hypothetical protein
MDCFNFKTLTTGYAISTDSAKSVSIFTVSHITSHPAATY